LSFQTGADAADITNVNGLANLSATDVNGTNGDGTNLSLASRSAVTSSATINPQATVVVSSVDTTVAANPNIATLSSGAYTVRVTVDAGTGVDDKVELLDSAGNAVQIDPTANHTGGVGSGVSSKLVDLDAGGTVDFGNGMSATFLAQTVAGAATSVVNYTAGGGSSYTVNANGAGGPALTTAATYRTLMTTLESKLDTVNGIMAKIGAFTGRLEFKEDQVMAAQINVEASYNRIMNANMAEEQVNSSKFQILQQTAIAMLAQANQAPASLLSLFK
jgi:flagellin